MASWRIIEGDCVEAMAAMEECSVDAVVCDPPYHLSFMGREWDHAPTGAESQEMHERWAREALRVLKPGGHLLAFGGTRTYHRLACAVEDAGFEIRDTICWLYGSGFPKSLDVSKAIDKAAGTEREVVGQYASPEGTTGFRGQNAREVYGGFNGLGDGEVRPITAPATPEAERWSGWGTALKPAHEPIVVARKPLVGTVAGNVLKHGTGALNVDGCRIEGAPRATGTVNPHAKSGVNGIYGSDPRTDRQQSYDANLLGGRWPANVALDRAAADMLDAQTGERPGATSFSRPERYDATSYHAPGGTPLQPGYGDSGGASRFFYVAKASRAERNAGLDGPTREVHRYGAGIGEGNDPKAPSIERNVHPTVKPIALMRWLVRLVTPPSGTLLDPFTGSGTTGCAAVLEGFDFIGCERDPEYVSIAKARIAWWAEHPEGQDVVAALDAEAKRQKVAATGQDDPFSSLTSKDETAPPSSSLTAGTEAA